jgi:hypothetical protein
MLVCNVSLRPPRSAIAADVAEITTAVDALATGNVVFATLVDDPASVGEIVDAYLGEIMLEAASASDTLTAGSAYVAAVDEAVTATDTQAATVGAVVVARAGMLRSVFINTGTTGRQAYIPGTMVNVR